MLISPDTQDSLHEAALWRRVKQRHGRVEGLDVFDRARVYTRRGMSMTAAVALAESQLTEREAS